MDRSHQPPPTATQLPEHEAKHTELPQELLAQLNLTAPAEGRSVNEILAQLAIDATAHAEASKVKLAQLQEAIAAAEAAISSYAKKAVRQTPSPLGNKVSWKIPEGYNWEVCTQENYSAPGPGARGALAAARELIDVSYHGHYTVQRERFQDQLIQNLLEGRGKPRKAPMVLFTAGAMGVGKSYVIEWLAKQNLLPLDEFVLIDPDRMAQQLPEWKGYFEKEPSSAALMTRLEAGLLTELGLVTALQERRNILVDSSLRHGSWYALLLERLKKELPDVVVVLMYIHAGEATIQQRAEERGKAGRAVSSTEVKDSLEKMPRAVGRLLNHVDHFVQVANDGAAPRVTSYCRTGRSDEDDFDYSSFNLERDLDNEDQEDLETDGAFCQVHNPDDYDLQLDLGWADIRKVLISAYGGEKDAPLPSPPRVLPTSSPSQVQPLLQLLRTMLFAAKKHEFQTRKDAKRTPYINHPLAVARVLAEAGIRDLATLQAALLHDTLEDTQTTETELRTTFGQEVTELVRSLTDDDSLRPVARKLVQLRGAKSLPLKAKLVRIADKLHNVWDLLTHGIPGWTQQKTEQYVAWACELVEALKGTHYALEKRFRDEISIHLPPGYQPGDWQRYAEKQAIENGDDDSSLQLHLGVNLEILQNSALTDHRDVLSLLQVAEFVAQHQNDAIQHETRSQEKGPGSGIIPALSAAVVLAQRGVRDSFTLKAALLHRLAMKDGSSSEYTPFMAKVRDHFGEEVWSILVSLKKFSDPDPSAIEAPKIPNQAKIVLLGEALDTLRTLQVAGISSCDAEATFKEHAKRAHSLRKRLAGTHSELEAGLDEVFCGQVRLKSGELSPVSRHISAVPCTVGPD